MEFRIASRAGARRFSYETNKRSIIISITDFWSRPVNFADNPNVIGILRLKFDDVSRGEENCMTEEDAKKIIRFVNNYIGSVECILVHCEAGVSRSAGVCAALMKIITGDDGSVFNNPRYYPNRDCYRVVLNSYFRSYKEDSIEEDYKKNIEKYRNIF